jgi:hypothetical protein
MGLAIDRNRKVSRMKDDMNPIAKHLIEAKSFQYFKKKIPV